MNLFYLSVCLILLMYLCIHIILYIGLLECDMTYRVGCRNPIKKPVKSPCLLVSPHEVQQFRRVLSLGDLLPMFLSGNQHFSTACPTRSAPMPFRLAPLKRRCLESPVVVSAGILPPQLVAGWRWRSHRLKISEHWLRYFSIWLWINTYENTIFNGMNIHKSQLFWCELQGDRVLTHFHIRSGRICIDGLKPPRNPC